MADRRDSGRGPRIVAVVQCTGRDLLESVDPFDYCIGPLKNMAIVEDIVIAAPNTPGSQVLRDAASQWGVGLHLGAKYNIAQRLLEAGRSAQGDIILRVLLKRFYLDTSLVEAMITRAVSASADYVILPRDFNYEFAGDLVSVRALERIVRDPRVRGEGWQAAMYRFSPWAFIEQMANDYRIVRMHDVPSYSKARAENIRAKYARLHPEHSSVYGCCFGASRYRFVGAFVRKGDAVLDIACGAGEGSLILAERSGSVVGVDLVRQPIDALLAGRDMPSNLVFRIADAETYCEEGSYDLVVTLHTLEHLNDDNAFLRNMWICLRPDGRIIIEVPLLMKRPMDGPLWPAHVREYGIEELLEKVMAAGFVVDQVFGGSRNRYGGAEIAREVVQVHARKDGGR